MSEQTADSKASLPAGNDQLPSSMRAVVIDAYGSAERLTLREIPRPICNDRQVTLRVRAASINPIDWRIRTGSLRWMLPAKFPLVLGFDVAGEIVEAGQAAQRKGWKRGDQVLGFLDSRHGGGYAQYAVAGADVIARKPATISFEEAAAVPLSALTALQSLRDIGKLAAGQEVLVNGASGGVGTFAVQIGRILGARVTGVCSASNADLVRELGAAHVIDYTRDDFTTQEQQYDIVFDAVAKSSYWRCRRILRPHGCFITTLPSASTLLLQLFTWRGRRCRTMLARPDGEALQFLVQKIGDGELRSVVEQTYRLDQALTAHQVSQAGHVRGKLVLSVP